MDYTDCRWTVTSNFLITAIGAFSAPYTPDFEGKEKFLDDSWHTSQWPKEEIDLIIYATGFDTVTGAFNQIDILGDRWCKVERQVGRWPVYLSWFDFRKIR